LHRLLPDRIYELYGLTEGFVTILDRDEALHKAGSVGVPPPFYEMRIVDDDGRELPANATGEIVGRGPITMPGYYGRDDLTAAALRDGWRDWINARVAAKYQRVAQVIVYEDFPRSAAGKTLKREMRAPFWKGRDRAI